LAHDWPIARLPGGEDYRRIVGALMAVNGQLVYRIADGVSECLA